MNCQFVYIEQLNRAIQHSVGSTVWTDEFGTRAGCILCGEIRVVWSNGELIIEKQGKEDVHGKTSNSKN